MRCCFLPLLCICGCTLPTTPSTQESNVLATQQAMSADAFPRGTTQREKNAPQESSEHGENRVTAPRSSSQQTLQKVGWESGGHPEREVVHAMTEDAQDTAELAESDTQDIVTKDTTTLRRLERLAIRDNPALQRLEREFQAAAARSQHVGRLPDPTIAGNVFVTPIETAAGSQRANVTFSQRIPSLARLDAQTQQACLEALAIQQIYRAQRFRLISEIRAAWYKLYFIGRKRDITHANRELVESLVEVATSKITTGTATQSDVLAGTVELGRLQEQLVTLRQQHTSTVVTINRLVGRPADAPVETPRHIPQTLPAWDHHTLQTTAQEQQPEIVAARIRTQAANWGFKIARLNRRPDLAFSASWFAIENNRPNSSLVDVGQDAWALGAAVTLPLNRQKFAALENEAEWKRQAAMASVDQTQQHYAALLRDLWEQARAADETFKLYTNSIVPQARATVEADQELFANGRVEFDRVIGNLRTLLSLEVGRHAAIRDVATAVARIRHVIGSDLTLVEPCLLDIP